MCAEIASRFLTKSKSSTCCPSYSKRSRGKVLLNRFDDGGGNQPNPESDTKLQENPGDQSHIVDDHHLNKNEEHDEQQERVSMYNHNFSFPWMYLVNHLKS